MNRRTFLRSTLATSVAFSQAGGLFAALEADNVYRKTLGLQLYTLRDALGKDPAGTLQSVAEMGYKQVELYGFPDSDAMIQGAKDAGLAIHSAHFNWDAAVNPQDASFSDFEKIVEKAKETGLTHLVVPFLQDRNRNSLDAYKKVAENLNKASAKTKAAGIQLSYHNHNFEFRPYEGGKSGYDIFMEEFGEDVQFEIDLFWVKVSGLDPVDMIRKLSGRVSQLHLKDLKKEIAETPTFDWVPGDAFQEVGDGVIDWEAVLRAAAAAGVKHCHVEQDSSPHPLESVKQSFDYLKGL